jgi:hypothetical protein
VPSRFLPDDWLLSARTHRHVDANDAGRQSL